MTTTAMNAVRASVRRGSGPTSNQIANVMLAVTSTSGTNTSLIRSARRWIGAFDPWARSTIATIEASTVSRPTRVARMTTVPGGIQRRADELVARPLLHRHWLAGQHRFVDRRSTRRRRLRRPGSARPGRTRSTSPARTAAERRRRPPGRPSIRRAIVACSPTSRRIAPVVWSLARASSQRPSRTRPMMTPRCRSRSPAASRRRGRGRGRGSRPRCRPRPRWFRPQPACPCSRCGGAPRARRARRTAGRPDLDEGRRHERQPVESSRHDRLRPEHREHQDGRDRDRDQRLDQQRRDASRIRAGSSGPAPSIARLLARSGRTSYPAPSTAATSSARPAPRRIDAHGRPLGGEVHVRLDDAVGLAEEALDPVDARGAGHPVDGQDDLDRLRAIQDRRGRSHTPG